MAVFQSRKYIGSADANKFGVRYRALMAKHPFLLFGLPFMAVIIGGSFVLTPATAIRYERQDRKVRQMTRQEELGVGKSGRKVDIREEYYVSYPQIILGVYVVLIALLFLSSVSQLRISTIGSRSGSSGFRGKATVCYDGREQIRSSGCALFPIGHPTAASDSCWPAGRHTEHHCQKVSNIG